MTGNASASDSGAACFHCGSPSPSPSAWRSVVRGEERAFCCAGCAAVAQMIEASGLAEYYFTRAVAAPVPMAAEDEWERYDVAGVASGLVVRHDDGRCEASLLLDGIRCAACIWLIENYVARQPGVLSIEVNFATRRALLRWDDTRTRLSQILRSIAALGYRAYPYDRALREALARRESRSLLLRASLALLAMMQVMMFALPAYTSADGVEPEHRQLLDYASLVLTLPVMLYCAVPFFAGALRDLRMRRLGMDVPVALGLGAAFAASAWTTITGSDAPVYYDSVTMFVALLLVARLFELRARRKSAEALESIARTVPEVAHRLTGFPASRATETVAAVQLKAGDRILLPAGSAIPADGIVVEGRSSVEEAILTGESCPRARGIGDAVLAGSVNRESPLIVEVSAAGAATAAGSLGRLVERLAHERPRIALLADRAAAWFVSALLVLTAVAAIVWWTIDPARVLPVAIAILVASCPCALSLATPAALAAAAGSLARRGVIVVRSGALETMARVTHVVFDKTGTLTEGRLQFVRVCTAAPDAASSPPANDRDAGACLSIAAALEQGSHHPIADALRAAAAGEARAHDIAHDIVTVAGSGVTGRIGGRTYRLGRPEWAVDACSGTRVVEACPEGPAHGADRSRTAAAGRSDGADGVDTALAGPAGGTRVAARALAAAAPDAIVVALADESGLLATFELRDSLRKGAHELVAHLKAAGLEVVLLSGDRTSTVANVARELGIDRFQAGQLPDDKQRAIRRLQGEGACVAMVGDGINDAPGLAQADVSLSLGSAATLAQWTAGVVVLGEAIAGIGEALAASRRAIRVIRMNIAWALAYNLAVIPLAAFGYLSPALAAIGMSASSTLVVGNALRLLRDGSADLRSAKRSASPAPAVAHG